MSEILVRIIRAKSRERRRAESQAAQGFCLGALRAKVRGPKSYDFDIPQIGVKIPQKILLTRGECKFTTDQNHKKNLSSPRVILLDQSSSGRSAGGYSKHTGGDCLAGGGGLRRHAVEFLTGTHWCGGVTLALGPRPDGQPWHHLGCHRIPRPAREGRSRSCRDVCLQARSGGSIRSNSQDLGPVIN